MTGPALELLEISYPNHCLQLRDEEKEKVDVKDE